MLRACMGGSRMTITLAPLAGPLLFEQRLLLCARRWESGRDARPAARELVLSCLSCPTPRTPSNRCHSDFQRAAHAATNAACLSMRSCGQTMSGEAACLEDSSKLSKPRPGETSAASCQSAKDAAGCLSGRRWPCELSQARQCASLLSRALLASDSDLPLLPHHLHSALSALAAVRRISPRALLRAARLSSSRSRRHSLPGSSSTSLARDLPVYSSVRSQ